MADPSSHRSSRDTKTRIRLSHDPMFNEQAPPPSVPMPPPPLAIPIRRKTMPTTDWNADARAYQQRRQEDEIMVEQGGPSENPGVPGLKRTDSSARKSGLGGMFGGVFGKRDKEKDRPDLKRRSTAPAEDESRAYSRVDRKARRSSRDADRNIDVTMTGAASEEDLEARKAARRARRAGRDAGQRSAEDARATKEEVIRERQRREEENEREARRAAKRGKKRAAERRVEEEREAKEAERIERRRARKEREAAQTGGDPRVEDPSRFKHRRSDRDVDDEARRRRREDRARSDPRKSSHKSAPDLEPEFLPADGPVYSRSKPKESPVSPRSGTDSWVKENSDAPLPPSFPTGKASPVDDAVGGEAERRRMRKTRPRGDEDDKRRRRDERRREKETEKPSRSSEGSKEDFLRESQRDSGLEKFRAASTSAGLFSRWKWHGGF